MSFSSTCDADKARNVLKSMFHESLPYTVKSEAPERIFNVFHVFTDEEATSWLEQVLCHGHFVSWRICPIDDMYVPTLHA